MLRLLQNKLSSKSLFFREIIAFVAFLHFFLIVFFCLIGFQQYKNEKFTIRSQSQLSSTIVFLPLQKYVDPAMNAGKKKGSLQKHQSRKVIDYQSYLKKQGYNVVSESKAKPSARKKKVAKKMTTALKTKKKKPVAKKTASTKASAKKKAPKKKSPASKKTVKKTVKKPVVKKKPVEKDVVKKSVEEPKIEKKKAVDKSDKKVVADTLDKVEAKKVEAAALPQVDTVIDKGQAKSAESIDTSDVTFVGYRELDKLQLQSKIQLAVEQYWSPPVGMPNKTVCELQVTIENKGKVVGAKVIKSSRIMAFDLAARSAIYKTKFPQDVWGKQITVELGI